MRAVEERFLTMAEAQAAGYVTVDEARQFAREHGLVLIDVSPPGLYCFDYVLKARTSYGEWQVVARTVPIYFSHEINCRGTRGCWRPVFRRLPVLQPFTL